MSTICSIFLNRINSAIKKIDEFVKSRIHQVFGVSYFVFRLTCTIGYFRLLSCQTLNTKY